MIQTERLDICEATAADIDTIIELETHEDNRSFVWQGSREEHLAEIDSPSHLLLVFRRREDEAAVGFALAHISARSRWFELRRIAVSAKGQGYGTEAIRALFRHAFVTLGLNKVWLDVYPHNTVGIRLYEKLGMHRDGVLRENYWTPEAGFLDQIIYSMLRAEYEGGQ